MEDDAVESSLLKHLRFSTLILVLAGTARAQHPPCVSDSDCPRNTVCSDGQCRPVERRLIIPPYYRSADGQLTAVFPLYWHKRPRDASDAGLRFVAPFYWHWWNDQAKGRIVFPFYFRHQDYREQVSSQWVFPFLARRDFGPKGKALGVLPLFYRSTYEDKRKFITPLWGWIGDDKSQLLITPLSLSTRREGNAFDLFLGGFFRISSKDSAFAFAIPLNFYWRSANRRQLLALPLFWERRDSGEGGRKQSSAFFWLAPPIVYSHNHDVARPAHFFTLFPVFWRTRKGDWTFTLLPPFFHRGRPDGYLSGLFPILWLGRNADRRQAVLFPIFWNFSSKHSATTVALNFFRHSGKDAARATVLPLLFFGHDKKAGTSYQLLLPLYYYGTSQKQRQAMFISPVFLWERDQNARVRHWGLVVPPFYHRRDAVRSIDALIPLLLRWHNADSGSTTWAAGPLVWHNDPEDHGTALFPLFFRFENKPHQSRGGLLGPFYWSHGPKHSTLALFPLAFYSRTLNRSTAVVFPLYWHLSDQARSSTLFLLYYHHRDPQGWAAAFGPLLWLGKSKTHAYQIVPPLFAHVRNSQEHTETWFLLPFYRTTRPTGHATGVAPLVFAGREGSRSYLTIPLLLFATTADSANGSRGLWIGPYFRGRNGNDRTDVFFPLVFRSQVFSGAGVRTSLTIFPLLHFSADVQREIVVSPLGGRVRDFSGHKEWGVLGLYAWHRAPEHTARAFLPFWVDLVDSREHSRTTVLFPFAVKYRAPQKQALVLFPLFWSLREGGETSSTLFPLYFRIRNDDPKRDDVDVVFPLFWSYRSSARRTHVVGPFYWKRQSNARVWGLVPLLFSKRDARSAYFIGFPLVWYFDDVVQRRRSLYFPLVYNRQFADGYSFGVLPVWFMSRRPESNYTVFFPLVWHFSNPRAKTHTTFVGPLFVQKRIDRRGGGILPIFWTFGNGAGERDIWVLPLANWKRRPDGWRLWTLPFGTGRSVESAYEWITPLWFRAFDHASQQRHLLIPPLLYYGSKNPMGRTDSALAIFFHRADVEGRSVVVFPLLWHFKRYHDRTTTLLLPLWLRLHNSAEKTTAHFFPWLLWIQSHPQGTDCVWLPLFYHFASGPKIDTVLFPLFWDFRRATERTTLIVPLFLRLARPHSDTWLVLPNVWYRTFKRDGGFQFIFFPVFELARIRPRDLRLELLYGLVGYERIGRNQFVKLLWFIDVPIGEPSSAETAWFGSETKRRALGTNGLP